jgi:hypothetical protein
MDEEGVVRARISGQSIEKIARAGRVSAAEVHAVLSRYCDRTLNPDVRRHGLAIELARLDRLLEAAWPKAMGGDLAAIAIAEKLSARRCVMLGLHAPQEAVLRIIEESRPKETSTDRIQRALNELCERRKLTEQRNSAPVVEIEAHGAAGRLSRSVLVEP